MDCHREYTAEQTDMGQMRNESTGTCYNVRLALSFQIHDPAKQRYAFAYTVALSFILIKQRLWSEKAQWRLRREPSAVTVDIYRSC